ncbi:hypothetical protein HKX48_007028 [Thoreauomyces humboldtii]|nr:hypothetical protein HKX48_007028 [Thoreauomyces humboldtii]
MPGKGKKKKAAGGGASKKRKGGKKGGKKGRGGKRMGAEQASTVLTFIMVEARKQSVLLYRTQYMEQKEELRQLRAKLRRVQQERYGHLRNVLDTTDAMTGKLETMQTSGFGAVGDLASDAKLVSQQEIIEDLHSILSIHSTSLAHLATTHATLQSSHAMSSLDAALQGLKTAQVDQAARHEAEVALLRKRHQAAVDGSRKRGEKIVMGVEGLASQNELDTLPASSLSILHRNSTLKAKTLLAETEHARLVAQVRCLNATTLEAITDASDVDWDLGLGLPALPPSLSSGSESPNGSASAVADEGGEMSGALPRLSAVRTALTLSAGGILAREKRERDAGTRRSRLGVLGARISFTKVDPKHSGGVLYSKMVECLPPITTAS